MGRRRNRPLVPNATRDLDRLKYEVAKDIGYIQGEGPPDRVLKENLDRMKFEVADELGLLDKIGAVGWGNMTSRECGRIGGFMGGKLGGQMVKRMIEYAEANMAKEQTWR